MMEVKRGPKRTTNPDVFISHSSRDKAIAVQLATALNCCALDVWLDDWELDLGQSLTDELAKAMDSARFIAILITENYNTTVWTKTEYKKALSREQKEGRVVMLPIVVGEAPIPAFIEDKIYVDLRRSYFSGITTLVGMVHGISKYRISHALTSNPPESISGVWQVLKAVGFAPYIVVGEDDFQEILNHGGSLVKDGYAHFSVSAILESKTVSLHVKNFMRQMRTDTAYDP